MAIPGVLNPSRIGPNLNLHYMVLNSGPSTYAMPAQNNGWAARFIALSAKDIKSVVTWWYAVAAAGTVQVRIETVDANGEPSGTLYDANATVDITPTAGAQVCTFATTPTTGLTPGTMYAIVMLTTVAGTTHTLSSHTSSTLLSVYPSVVLTGADVSTRTNFAELSGAIPIVSLVMDDDTEEINAFSPHASSTTTNNIYGTNISAAKFTLLAGVSVAGVAASTTKSGTPAGNLLVNIRDTSNNIISGATCTIDKTIFAVGSHGKSQYFPFASPVTLLAGTYYVVISSADSANSSNCWTLRTFSFTSSGAVASNFRLGTNTSDTTVGMTDSTTAQAPVWLVVDADVQDPTDAAIAQAIWEYGNRTLTA